MRAPGRGLWLVSLPLFLVLAAIAGAFPASAAALSYCVDSDQDGWFVESTPGACPAGTLVGDCADENPAIHPGATETCNDLDDDCDGLVDEGLKQRWFNDVDRDGFGNPGEFLDRCAVPPGFVADGSDCDDVDASVFPHAAQLCDGKNNDCTDPLYPAAPWDETDDDADGFRICAGDCDDGNAALNPAAAEICGDGLDNDCNGPDDELLGGVRYVDAATSADADGGNTCLDPARPCHTIAHALVVSCLSGDTVTIAAGTYPEALIVAKPVVLLGEQAGVDARARSGAETLLDPAGALGIDVRADGVVLDGITITGASTAVRVTGWVGSLTVRNVVIEGSAGADGIDFGRANTTVETSLLRNLAHAITGGYDGGTPSDEDDVRPSATIRDNEIVNATIGISGYLEDALIERNLVRDCAAEGHGIGGQFLGTEVRANTVRGYTAGSGIGLYAAPNRMPGGFSIRENVLSGNAYAVSTDGSMDPLVMLSGNDLSGSLVTPMHRPPGADLDASANWWGTTDPAVIGAAVGSSTDFSPYLHTGADVSPEPGWQGDFSFLHVALTAQFTPVERIQEAVDLVTGTTPTVQVEAGDYGERVRITSGRNGLVLTGAEGATVAVFVDPPTSGDEPVISLEGTPDDPLTGVVVRGLSVRNITGPGCAVSLGANVTGALVEGNDLTGSVTGFCVADGATGAAHGNAITGNATGVSNAGATAFDATCNWWGAATGPGTPGADTTSGAVSATSWLIADDHGVDADGDGHSTCTADGGGDCDVARADVYPGAPELCDGADNDCSGGADEGGDALCDDAQFCNGAETCAGLAGCLAGAVPDCTDVDGCTDDACDPAAAGGGGACAHVAWCSVAGHVFYTRVLPGPTDGPDLAKPVADVVVGLAGPASGTASTDLAGAFAFHGASGLETLTPQPKAATADDLYLNALSSQDAATIAQEVVQLVTFSPHQLALADVSDNGRVTSYDAALVAQKLVEREAFTFPVAVRSASDWAWFPATATLDMTPGGDQAFDFAAGLWGDVTNSWAAPPALAAMPATALAFPAPSPAPPPRTTAAEMYIAAGPQRLADGTWEVTLGLARADGIRALDLDLEHADGVSVVEARATGIASGFRLASNGRPGVFRVALYGSAPLAGTGPFLVVRLKASRALAGPGFSILAEANEGLVPLRAAPGTPLRGGRAPEAGR